MTRLQTGEIKCGFVDGMGFGLGWGFVKQPTGVTEALSPGSFGHGGAFGTQAWIDPKKGRFADPPDPAGRPGQQRRHADASGVAAGGVRGLRPP